MPAILTSASQASLSSTLILALISTFTLSSLIGVWAAYDRTIAWTRFSLLAAGIVFVVVMLWESQHARERIATLLLWIGAGVATAIGVLYVVSHTQQLSIIHPNVAGGALAVTIPLAAAGAYHTWARRSYSMAVVLGTGVCIAGVALLLTSSRGAWIGVAAGAGVTALAGQRTLSRWQSYGAIAGLTTILVAGFLIATQVPGVEQQLQIAGADGSTLGRIAVWRDMLYLIQDYPLTGSGLGMTAMVYSSYVLLLHVPFLYHAHNLFLQIAAEQGIVGLVAFIGMAAVALETLFRMPVVSELQRTYRAASIFSLTAALVHGMFDAELYVSMLAPLVFFPIGSAFLYAQDLFRCSAPPDAGIRRWHAGCAYRRCSTAAGHACDSTRQSRNSRTDSCRIDSVRMAGLANSGCRAS